MSTYRSSTITGCEPRQRLPRAGSAPKVARWGNRFPHRRTRGMHRSVLEQPQHEVLTVIFHGDAPGLPAAPHRSGHGDLAPREIVVMTVVSVDEVTETHPRPARQESFGVRGDELPAQPADGRATEWRRRAHHRLPEVRERRESVPGFPTGDRGACVAARAHVLALVPHTRARPVSPRPHPASRPVRRRATPWCESLAGQEPTTRLAARLGARLQELAPCVAQRDHAIASPPRPPRRCRAAPDRIHHQHHRRTQPPCPAPRSGVDG
jgi:hypothetical protein